MRGSVQLERVGYWAAILCALPGVANAAEGLNLSPNIPLLVGNLVLFALLIWPVNRLLISPLVGILQEREARTTGSTDEADTLLADAARERGQLEARRLEARRQASDRRAAILTEGKAAEQQVVDAARADAAASVAEVRGAIEGELAQARETLRDDARALAEEAAARILGRSL